MRITVPSPAKLNLFLAITGQRADGFHDLVSLVAPLEFGDEIEAIAREPGSGFTLECAHASVPADASNLILRATAEFVARTGWKGAAHFRLTKKIPIGAGLGGGSSNAVAALRALNYLSHDAASVAQLGEMAAALGSDCPLFLVDGPVAMRGRGERIERVAQRAESRICGRRVLVFKPSFGVSTPWAYRRMAERGSDYLSAPLAETRLQAWVTGDAPLETLLFNSMEPAVFEKYLALPVLLERLREAFGIVAHMSGSGSACFALLPDDVDEQGLTACIRDAWGDAAFIVCTRVRT